MSETTTLERDIAPLLIEQLREGKPVRFRAEGRSMEPFLFAGDVVEVLPLQTMDDNPSLRPGDVLCYERAPDTLRLHRFVRWEKTVDGVSCLRVRGDALGQNIENIPPEAVLGVLVAFEHEGQRHSARHLRWRMAGLWWPRLRSRILRRRPAPQNFVDDLALRQRAKTGGGRALAMRLARQPQQSASRNPPFVAHNRGSRIRQPTLPRRHRDCSPRWPLARCETLDRFGRRIVRYPGGTSTCSF